MATAAAGAATADAAAVDAGGIAVSITTWMVRRT